MINSSFKESQPEAEKLFQKNNLDFSSRKNVIRFCTNCGSSLEVGDLFCDECGSKIEQEESSVVIENDEQIVEEHPLAISSDRMASIIQTNKIKTGESNEDFVKSALSAISIITETKEVKLQRELEEKAKILGYYIYKDSYMTQYLVIEEIKNNSVKALVKTTFTNGGYANEFYDGIFSGDEIHLNLVDSDLHPPTNELQFSSNTPKVVNYTIQVSEKFDGIISENEISGSFSGHFSNSVIFKKC